MKTIIQRLKSETPKFFKVLRNMSITLGVAAKALVESNSTLNLGLSVDFIQVLNYAIAISIAVAVTAQTAKTT
jgi:hypothetical protein